MRHNCHQFIHFYYSWEGHSLRWWPSWFEISLRFTSWASGQTLAPTKAKVLKICETFLMKPLKLQNHCLLFISPNTEYKLNTTKNSYLQRPQWAEIIKSSLRQWSKQIPWKVSRGKEEMGSLFKILSKHITYYLILSWISYDMNKNKEFM